MVRSRSRRTAPTIPSNALVASAVRYPGKVSRIYVGAKEWQKECYRQYAICGEARYSANYYGHALSKARIYPVESATDSTELTSGPAFEALEALFNGPDGQEQMLTSLGIHLCIAGEAYLIGRQVPVEDPDTGVLTTETDEVWEVLSVLEVHKQGQKWSISSKEEGEMDITLGDDDVVIRIWRPDPERRLAADSPFKALLPVLREIEVITLRIFAESQSRLTGAGIMFVSQDVTFPEPPKEVDGQKVEATNEAEGLLYTLAEAMISAVENQGAPESIAPVVVTVPGEVWANGGKVAELMHFWSQLDENAQEMRNSALQRFALGMDMPPEKILGVSSNAGTGGGTTNGVSHWGAWQIDEDFIKVHIDGALGLICNALVIGFLRPITGGMEALRADTSGLRLRPDRSKEAVILYDHGLLKGEVVVRENGFDPDTDMMDEAEQKRWLTIKVATGSATPEQVQAALRALGVDLGDLIDPNAQPRETRPDPSLDPLPIERKPPEMDAPAAANLMLAVSEPLVLTALSRAGNKLRQRGKGGAKPTGTKAHEVHTVIAANGLTDLCMDDAFPHAHTCLNGNGVPDPEKVIAVLDAYVRTLLANQRPHDRRLLAKALETLS